MKVPNLENMIVQYESFYKAIFETADRFEPEYAVLHVLCIKLESPNYIKDRRITSADLLELCKITSMDISTNKDQNSRKYFGARLFTHLLQHYVRKWGDPEYELTEYNNKMETYFTKSLLVVVLNDMMLEINNTDMIKHRIENI